ncbi:cora-like Mg2+ transporter protein-domain-containing protein [Boletus coccyginus]|nr:cora-like Mg2+ transporter protein-domain-containing protein [Boletus coccyginus]
MTTATGIQTIFPRHGVQLDVSEFRQEAKVPAPKYRHAAPSAPWPWMDFDHDDLEVPPLSPGTCEPWSRYPQSHFGSWGPEQVQRSRMLTICKDQYMCHIHKVDIFKDGMFDRSRDLDERIRRIPSDATSAAGFWDDLNSPLDSNLRVRALFVEDITLNVLQILGARYDIEPFFFASSANWIPSRYQENPHPQMDDHITIVLPFIRKVSNQQEWVNPTPFNETRYPQEERLASLTDTKQTIDTQAPLVLSDQTILLHDLLAIHMVRSTGDNTIISYHHHSELQRTTARRLQSLVQRTGDSVYWSKIFHRSKDPTFVFLTILWYALYAWDEALEVLHAHLTQKLESADGMTHLKYTRELHKLQAHLFHYEQLLRDFRKSVEFVRDTPNPAMDHDSISDLEREASHELLVKESTNLLSEIERLEKQRQIQSSRLTNAMDLVLTQATMQDSAVVKQLSYLTIIFLPASFLSGVFGMNVIQINTQSIATFAAYVGSTIILTLLTASAMIALQEHSSFYSGGRYLLERVARPVFYCYTLIEVMTASVKSFLAWLGV